MNRFDFNLFSVLGALHETGSVSAAARRLGRTQPAVSMALTRLRRHFGDPLYVRGAGQGMVATPLGQRLGEQAAAIVSLAEGSIHGERAFDPATAEDEFVFALSDVGELVFLPPIVEALAAVAPCVAIRSVTLPPADTERALEDGSIDLAIGHFPDLKTGHFQQRLFTHHFVCVARAGHPRCGIPFTREQFLECGHAVALSSSRSQELFERFLARERITRQVLLRTAHFTSLPFALARSDLIATVPHALGIAFTRDMPILQMMKLPFDVPAFDLRQYWHRRFHKNARSIWLRRFIAGLFNDVADEWGDDLEDNAASSRSLRRRSSS
jgi:DNA-binding transcriptional LysR family regulator